MFAALLLSLAAPAAAEESSATTCIRTKVDSDYQQGWALRGIEPLTLAEGGYAVVPITLMPGLTYRFRACSPVATDIDLIVYDATGKEITRDRDDNGRPQLDYSARRAGTWYLVVHLADLRTGYDATDLAWSVSYR
jgi:hypothetical protein